MKVEVKKNLNEFIAKQVKSEDVKGGFETLFKINSCGVTYA